METTRAKKYKIINKTRFFLFLTTVLVLIFMIFYTFKVDARAFSEIKVDSVYVSSGDTLWSLSTKYVGKNMDIRDYIEGVIKYNNLQSINIRPGQLIYMPIYSNEY